GTGHVNNKLSMTLSSDWLADMANNNVGLEGGGGGDQIKKVFAENGSSQKGTFGPVVQLIGVSVRKDRRDRQTGNGRHAFRSLNLTFTGGRICAIIGEAQSGKTALLHTLAKIRPPAAGKVKYLSFKD